MHGQQNIKTTGMSNLNFVFVLLWK